MVKIFLVGAGGFIGSVSRYLLGGVAHRVSGNHWFPYGTLTVNIIGCFVIGLVGGIAQSKHIFADEIRLFLVVGLLGGFTTFSSFSHETVMLAKNTQGLAALLNVLFQVCVSLSAAWLGHYLVNH
ncbi:Fluoride ion transporter CrcB [hydrothermal vent metagenome]|uniref:Fluoride ion transporter CrcB n=1 Tax=hydrothermal vent metagenome TaxID=652676 RepID=A0A3B1CWE0_9ZZZZ